MFRPECCFVRVADDRAQVRADGAPKNARKTASQNGLAGTKSVNSGLGSVAAGEVALEDLVRTTPRSGSKAEAADALWLPLDPELSLKDGQGARGSVRKRATLQAGRTPPNDSLAGDAEDELMPFRRQKTARMAGNGSLISRKSIACMEGYLGDRAGCDPPGVAKNHQELDPVTKDHFQVSALVVRGPDWRWGNEDGGTGQIGTIGEVDRKSQTIKVTWRATQQTHNHYRCGRCTDLAPAPLGAGRGGSGAPGLAGAGPDASSSADPRIVRSCSAKDLFTDRLQTFICFDWDDTLFPTTYVRDDLDLDWRTPMRSQRLPGREKADATHALDQCADTACALLRAAAGLGKVVLVTLARSPWIRDSCSNFFPKIGALITELKVPVIYAQEGQHINYNKADMSSNADIEQFWSQVKGKAITNELRNFYSQYEGQSWKNIISIGDSDFERLGTQQATEVYMKQTGINTQSGILRQKTVEVKGHVYKVRTKTFKMLDQPTVDELTVELAMLQKWLPFMVELDDNCDVNLNDVEDPATLQNIEKTLRGRTPLG